ncbi:NAD(P)H-hydrate dehydratase [Silvimonas sp.]|uniref:NAD(P)H-hydrate dehydratase n=1 Tax=Silvimonas sp. TaxID=2650811 RepID=UPI002852AB5C|nr:NAD(P)H-hydrate dehydratase [Silvimonas sp.]
MTHPLYCAGITREIEQIQASAGVPLMARAGEAAANWIQRRFALTTPITVLVGPGNNGGDGLTVAWHLKASGYSVRVHYVGNPEQASPPTANAHKLWQQAGGRLDEQWTADAGVVIDALFGIGLSRNVPTDLQQLFSSIIASRQRVIALDIPSGLHADTGAILGAALPAQATLTFIGDKPGLHTANGRDYAGDVTVFDLGISQDAFPESDLQLFALKQLPGALRRQQESHKGTYGTVGIIGGAKGMTGAALMAGRAALKLGAGKVRIGLLGEGVSLDPLYPELMLNSAEALMEQQCDVHLIGPGLGRTEQAHKLLEDALSKPGPLVIDADALNLIAGDSKLASACQRRGTRAVITPHPTEAARLLGTTTAAVQADRLSAARDLAGRFTCVAVLKGSGTVVCDGTTTSINSSGNAALAAAGQGDILGGIITALLGQGLDPPYAARVAVFIHGAAADNWVKAFPNAIGLTAGETIDYARQALNDLEVE